MGRTISPLGDRVVVKPSGQEEVSAGGILLPDTAKERPQEGEVIAAGPGRVTMREKPYLWKSKLEMWWSTPDTQAPNGKTPTTKKF